ncbi:MAG: peptidoglycan editing factor PgeF [Candidatus Omnitrophica bacterium]|nr:peptidoglycan editing factor PgeF [Candidatus Omnitrophota bacterium]
MHPEIYFKDTGVLALTSDASIDFTPVDFDSPLTSVQRAYLWEHCKIDMPQVFWRKQIHGDDILEAHKSFVIPISDKNIRGQAAAGIFNAGVYKGCGDADAYVTDEKNLPIAIRTADCVPVFIFDPRHRAIGLVHAGWKGTYKAIAAKTAQRMHEKYASKFSELQVVLGPCIRECCYQVGEEFRDYFPLYVRNRGSCLYLDMPIANRDQLLQLGLLKENILDCAICTCCNRNYFSFRRDGAKTGRMISLMMLL